MQVSVLKQQEAPQIWVAAGDNCSFLERFHYALTKLPSHGLLTNQADLPEIKVLWQMYVVSMCEQKNMLHMRAYVCVCIYI